MKKIILLNIVLCIASVLFAQVDSIENEIKNYESSNIELVLKARRLLQGKLLLDDYVKVKEIKDYLVGDLQTNEYLTLTIPEYWLILYWTQEFDQLLQDIEQIGYQQDARQLSAPENQLKTFNDKLFETLRNKSIGSKEVLDVVIENSDLTREEKDFLLLHLNFCLADFAYQSSAQDSLNKQSDKFLMTYPTSHYAPFVRKVIRYKEKVSDFGWGYDLFIGYNVFNGGISETFSNYFLFGMSIDLAYYDFILNLSFSIGGSELKKEINYESIIWDKGLRGDILIPQASIGYTFFSNSQFNITPFVGVSSLYIAPQYDDVQAYSPYENIELFSGASWNAGMSVNLFSKPAVGGRNLSRASQFKGFIKLKYNYFHSGYKKDYYGLDGSMHQITLSFGGFAKRVRQSY